ncbi:triose-phosphate isomerase [Pseudolactococcus yaeyamensis]
MKKVVKAPFFMFNPKSYLYGEELLKMAVKADELAEKYPEITVFVTCPFADISTVAATTQNIIVTAQHMDGIQPGRGMGHVLPESIYAAGARAVFLNHAERALTLAELTASMKRARELEILTIVCADSLEEALAVAMLNPDIILCEPTELIGTGQTSDDSYINETNEAVRAINKDVLIMQASGVSTAEDVYHILSIGAHGTGCTSGITNAGSPIKMLEDMVEAAHKVYLRNEERK